MSESRHAHFCHPPPTTSMHALPSLLWWWRCPWCGCFRCRFEPESATGRRAGIHPPENPRQHDAHPSSAHDTPSIALAHHSHSLPQPPTPPPLPHQIKSSKQATMRSPASFPVCCCLLLAFLVAQATANKKTGLFQRLTRALQSDAGNAQEEVNAAVAGLTGTGLPAAPLLQDTWAQDDGLSLVKSAFDGNVLSVFRAMTENYKDQLQEIWAQPEAAKALLTNFPVFSGIKGMASIAQKEGPLTSEDVRWGRGEGGMGGGVGIGDSDQSLCRPFTDITSLIYLSASFPSFSTISTHSLPASRPPPSSLPAQNRVSPPWAPLPTTSP